MGINLGIQPVNQINLEEFFLKPANHNTYTRDLFGYTLVSIFLFHIMNIKGSGRAGGAIIGISNSSSSHHHRAASIPEEEEYSERDYYDSDDHSIVTDASSFHLTTTIKNDHITIFQAAPLAGMNGQGNLGAIQTLDLAQERQQLTRIFANTRVAVEFQIATHETLGKFLETKQGTILHFSCHGDAGQLFLEDDWGGLAPLAKEHLKKWVQLGGRELQFVFVSACYSQSIGQAFVDAGVPHVICSREDAKLMVGVSGKNDHFEFECTWYERGMCHLNRFVNYSLVRKDILSKLGRKKDSSRILQHCQRGNLGQSKNSGRIAATRSGKVLSVRKRTLRQWRSQ